VNRPETLAAHGFHQVVHNAKHKYWMRQGLGAQSRLEAAV
jgi:hypothetical protein